jgi:hypothetical protein
MKYFYTKSKKLSVMKNLLGVFVLVVLTAGFTSCESIKGIFDVEVDTTIEGDLMILTDDTELKSTNDYGFDASVTVQVLNDDLYEYEDKIQDFKTSDVTIEVLSVDSSGVLLLSGTEFMISNANASYTWTLTSDWAIEPGLSVTLDAESYDVIDQILDDRVDFTMAATGSCNKANVTIELRYGIETTVVANPL